MNASPTDSTVRCRARHGRFLLGLLFHVASLFAFAQTDWQARDIGAVAAPGFSNDSGVYVSVRGSGADIWGAMDEFHFRHRSLTGDGEFVARLTTMSGPNPWAKAGLMFREGIEANARHGSIVLTRDHGTGFQSRVIRGGATTYVAGAQPSGGPLWLKLVRTGNRIAGFESVDGSAWNPVASVTVEGLATALQIGFAVTSHDDGRIADAHFDLVRVQGSAPGNAPAAPSALRANPLSMSLIELSWEDNAASETGFEIERSPSATSGFVRIGVTGRDMGVFIDNTVSAGTTYFYRVRAINDSAASAWVEASARSASTYGPLKPRDLLVRPISSSRIGLTWTNDGPGPYRVAIERSLDAVSYVAIGTTAGETSAYEDAGLAPSKRYYYRIRAFNDGGYSDYVYGDAFTAPTDSQWANGDIGFVGAMGSTTINGGTISLEGSGADIWGTSDAFHYRYQELKGSGQITVRLTQLTNTHPWAKAGVMFRERIAADARNVFLCATIAHGTALQWRPTGGGESMSVPGAAAAPLPRWLRLVRAGNAFTGYESADGLHWVERGTVTMTLPETIYVGHAVTSHQAGVRCTATFDSIAVVAGATVEPPPSAPNAPTGVATQVWAPSHIDVTWLDNSTDETGFSIERSTDGINFTGIGTVGPNVRIYGDYAMTGTAATITYHYRVQAVAGAARSAYSAVATASYGPAGVGFTTRDIGDASPAGSSAYDAGLYTVRGAGADIWGTADSFVFESQPWTGNGEIVVRVVGMEATDAWAKAGVMFREALTPGARNAFIALTAENGIAFQTRATAGGSTSFASGGSAAAPVFLKLTRQGNQFDGFRSADGVAWTRVGTVTLDLPATIHVGLAVTSHRNGVVGTARFNELRLRDVQGSSSVPPSAPTNFTAIANSPGEVSLRWTDTADNEDGVQLERSTDGVAYAIVYWPGPNVVGYLDRAVSADTLYYYRVRTINAAGASAYATVTVRTPRFSSTPPAAPTDLTASAVSASQVDLRWRDHATTESGFEIERSTDGVSFSRVASGAPDLIGTSDTGLAASTTYYYRVRAMQGDVASAYSNVAVVTTRPAGSVVWQHADVGSVGLAGSDDASGGTFTVTGSGADIWENADGFRFLYRAIRGDCVVEARVTSMTQTHPWAKAGVMIRETLAATSRNVFAMMTPANGVFAQARVANNGTTVLAAGPWGATLPYWVRLARTGNTIVASASEDGVQWTPLATYEIAMAAEVYVGFAVTSHHNAALNTATFAEPYTEGAAP